MNMSSITCFNCKNAITSGAYLTVGNLYFHQDHFNCQSCGKKIEGTQYFKDKENILCKECYEEKKADKCAHCGKPIVGQFYNVEGKTYHKECYENFVLQKCSVCNTIITGTYFDIGQRRVHKECFVCFICKKAFVDNKFCQKDGIPYCPRDLAQTENMICGGCNDPIVGTGVSCMNKNYHKEHFNCAHCKKPFTEDGFIPYDGKGYHDECYDIADLTLPPPTYPPLPAPAPIPIPVQTTASVPAPPGPAMTTTTAPPPASGPPPPVFAQTPPAPMASVPPVPGQPPAPVPAQTAAPTPAPPTTAPAPAPAMEAKSHYTLAELQAGVPPGVDPLKKEAYLTDEEFRKVFGMDKGQFYGLANWRQGKLKNQHKLNPPTQSMKRVFIEH
eukprot:TRINITY_DN2197_c0_g2_i5.p2 TRINITY_DN2197_c0_g2~~TRINITY_DN2197_c0_g2_i5.p2  ORF type:complete len:386 (-),score=75.83 TRINITY_DN2197_c0_g2_i5:1157-2314(-)